MGLGHWQPFRRSTVTAGIISAKARDLNTSDDKNQSFLQTDAAVNQEIAVVHWSIRKVS